MCYLYKVTPTHKMFLFIYCICHPSWILILNVVFPINKPLRCQKGCYLYSWDIETSCYWSKENQHHICRFRRGTANQTGHRCNYAFSRKVLEVYCYVCDILLSISRLSVSWATRTTLEIVEVCQIVIISLCKLRNNVITVCFK